MIKYIKNPFIIGVIAWILVLVVLVAVPGPDRGNSPEGLIGRFEKAVNDYDEDAVTELFSEEYQALIKAGYSYMGSSLLSDLGYDEDDTVTLLVSGVEYVDEDEESANVCYFSIVENHRGNKSISLVTREDAYLEDGTWYLGGF